MEWINTRAGQMQKSPIRKLFDRASGMRDVIHLEMGEPDLPTPAGAVEAADRAARDGKTHYTANNGIPSLRRAIAASPFANGLSYDPETEVIVTVGAINALALALMCIIEPGEGILVQDPVWLDYFELAKFVGGEVRHIRTVPEEGFRVSAERVRQALTPNSRVLMLNTPGNPTGVVLSRPELEEIARVAVEHDLLVVCDEVYRTLIYDGVPSASIAECPGMKERTLVVNSVSKAFAMTGWRVGFAMGPAKLIAKMTQLQEYLNACVATPCQYAAQWAVEHFEAADAMREICDARRKVMVAGLHSIPGIRCAMPAGAFYAFADVRAFGMETQILCERILEEARVVCTPGSCFGSCGEGFIRFSYANSIENIEEAIRRLRTFAARLPHADF